MRKAYERLLSRYRRGNLQRVRPARLEVVRTGQEKAAQEKGRRQEVMSPEEEARHAQFLLDDPVLVKAFERVKQDALEKITNSRPQDTETRETAYLEYQAAISAHDKLKGIVNNIKLAAMKRRS